MDIRLTLTLFTSSMLELRDIGPILHNLKHLETKTLFMNYVSPFGAEFVN